MQEKKCWTLGRKKPLTAQVKAGALDTVENDGAEVDDGRIIDDDDEDADNTEDDDDEDMEDSEEGGKRNEDEEE